MVDQFRGRKMDSRSNPPLMAFNLLAPLLCDWLGCLADCRSAPNPPYAILMELHDGDFHGLICGRDCVELSTEFCGGNPRKAERIAVPPYGGFDSE
ncbi:hypothetical protein Metme_2513 [Methylomonas methanica MC09]|uniref:Uncharacterized protein n=1 Tax=Methylomonas methanica (strain DSM 25384 / MC09) TaxID=857087 RepID=F9ZWQ7_METMM|nr:hypothetical protein Metme_2513 [Methylomonas methanica MC09]